MNSCAGYCKRNYIANRNKPPRIFPPSPPGGFDVEDSSCRTHCPLRDCLSACARASPFYFQPRTRGFEAKRNRLERLDRRANWHSQGGIAADTRASKILARGGG